MLKKVLNSIIAVLIVANVALVTLFILEEKEIVALPFIEEKEMDKEVGFDISDIEFSTEKNKSTHKKKDEQESDRKNRDYDRYVFVGDSRFVGISKYYNPEEDIFIAKIGEGYSYLMQQMSTINYYCDENTALIIGLGVNDGHANAENYITTLNEMADTMDCQIYFTSVNPVDEAFAAANGYNVKSEVIDEFNEKARTQLDDRIVYIDTNQYLENINFETQDGLHYTEYISEKLYNYIKRYVGPYEDVLIDEE